MSAPGRASPRTFSARRMGAIVLRHGYVLRRSVPRLVELAYLPTVQMILWGFISQFFVGHSDWVSQAAGILIGAVLLWDTLFRAQLGVSVSFLEEMWSRNLAHIFISPIRPAEYMASLVVMSVLRTAIGMLPAMLIAIPLYHFSIFELGLPLVAFFAALMAFGWSFGLLICALLVRWGLAAESIAWFAMLGMAPFSAVYYPVSSLPDWLQPVAWALPSTYVFEGMRGLMLHGVLDTGLLVRAFALDALYLALAAAAFLYALHAARRGGALLKTGE